jgi:hypothetical protein
MVGGIGGPGGSGPPGKVGGVGAPNVPSTTAPTGAKFGEALGKTEKASGTSPLEQLRAGEIDLKGYVDVRVREATAHLEGVLGPEDLAKVQDELRDVIENDPDIAALVKGAEIGR